MIEKLRKKILTETQRIADSALLKFMPRRHYLNGMEERTKNLGDHELIYLYKYVFQGKDTLYVKLCDETMAVLYTKELTERNRDRFKTIDGYGYDLNAWAREYLEENKDIFDGCLLHKTATARRRT